MPPILNMFLLPDRAGLRIWVSEDSARYGVKVRGVRFQQRSKSKQVLGTGSGVAVAATTAMELFGNGRDGRDS